MDCLLLIFNDFSFKILHIKPTSDINEALRNVNKVIDKQVIKSQLLDSGELPPVLFQNCFRVLSNLSLALEKPKVITAKLDSIRNGRENLFNQLDLELKRTSDQDIDILERIQFLRDIPEYFPLDDLEIQDIIKLNPFCNIWKIVVTDGGDGYETPPSVEIEAPINGMPAKASAKILDKKVSEIIVDFTGCGYTKQPIITIEESPTNQRAKAFATTINLL